MAGKSRLPVSEVQKAFLKIGLYGGTGTGKTGTALKIAEWLAKKEGKKVAFIDTEHGVDFYRKAIPERKFHPEAFDIEAFHTRQIVWVRDFLETIDDEYYGVVVIDSVSHLWDAAQELYTGPKTSKGTNPIHAWSTIKRPWRQMIDKGQNGKFHFIICGREANVFNTDTGEWEFKGTRMRAEKEAGYEPDVTCKMMQDVNKGVGGKNEFTIQMYVEKDRSGVLMGKTIAWPDGETFAPLYGYLTGQHGAVDSVEEAAAKDVDLLEREAATKEAERRKTFESIRDAILKSQDKTELHAAWNLTKGKKMMLGDDMFEALKALRDGRNAEIAEGKAAAAAVAGGN